MLDDLKNDIERAECLQSILLSRATGGTASNNIEYQHLRSYFLRTSDTKDLLPSFVRTNRDIDQFWQLIKNKFDRYEERRKFIWAEFRPLLDHLEGNTSAPADTQISEGLESFDKESVHAVWSKAIERRTSDPEGAITTARTLLETVCKHILDIRQIEYNSHNIKLPALYKLTAKELNLSPNQHTEEIFKQILGGCFTTVEGLGALRNRLGDAHGKGIIPAKPAPRHAELAVNLAGSLALFLVATWEAQCKK